MTRLIPACAGKTKFHLARGVQGGAHPRVCGENATSLINKYQTMGSSPRVRGKPFAKSLRRRRCGLIPACAGKTRHRLTLAATRKAHPRVCGENCLRSVSFSRWAGSSPRVRGKREQDGLIGPETRLIPACAGKTSRIAAVRACLRAHPRVCGENAAVFNSVAGAAGSSPRVRGKQRRGGLGVAC